MVGSDVSGLGLVWTWVRPGMDQHKPVEGPHRHTAELGTAWHSSHWCNECVIDWLHNRDLCTHTHKQEGPGPTLAASRLQLPRADPQIKGDTLNSMNKRLKLFSLERTLRRWDFGEPAASVLPSVGVFGI